MLVIQINMKVIDLPVIEISKDNFDAEIMNSELPVVLDFWGPNCGPCLSLMPKYHELAENPKYAGKVKFCSVDTSKNRRIAVSFRVMSLPVFLFCKNGKEAARLSGGAVSIEAITAKIEELTA